VKLVDECGPCGCKRELDGADEATVRRAQRRWSLQHGRCVRTAQRDLGRLADRERTGTGFAATSISPDRPDPYGRSLQFEPGPRRVES